MKRRDFLTVSALSLGWVSTVKSFATGSKAITEKEILKDGMPATVANYCEDPKKQPNKLCPAAKGLCSDCMFYNKDGSKGQFKGKEVARCQLLADPSKPQFVWAAATCATFVKKS